ncbi:MAG: hypothetical protein J7K00_03935 [Candidatus Diapherotrites archaeon]|nr:hypothetical protein [Candidatus Diapherotrites archaeon]
MINPKFAFAFLAVVLLFSGCIQQPPADGLADQQPADETTKLTDETPVVEEEVQESVPADYEQVETDIQGIGEISLLELPEESEIDVVSTYGSEELDEQVW